MELYLYPEDNEKRRSVLLHSFQCDLPPHVFLRINLTSIVGRDSYKDC